jgi:hypothetical protein
MFFVTFFLTMDLAKSLISQRSGGTRVPWRCGYYFFVFDDEPTFDLDIEKSKNFNSRRVPAPIDAVARKQNFKEQKAGEKVGYSGHFSKSNL